MPILPCFFLHIEISLLSIPLDNPRFVLPCFTHCYSNDQTVILSKSCDGFFFKFRENGRRVTPESNLEFLHEDTCMESPPGEISFSPLTTVGAQEDLAGKKMTWVLQHPNLWHSATSTDVWSCTLGYFQSFAVLPRARGAQCPVFAVLQVGIWATTKPADCQA